MTNKTPLERAIERLIGISVEEIREMPLQKPRRVRASRFSVQLRPLTHEEINAQVDKAIRK